MKEEFKRYDLERFRLLTGILEVAGGLGILVGFVFNPLYLFSTLGLGLLMGLGLLARIRAKDPVIQMVPALALMIINFWLFWTKL